ncbi:MAG: alpha-amylase family glycosyl hydrolase [Myxococcota bacterium]
MTYAPQVPAVVYEIVPDRFRIGGGVARPDKLKGEAYQRRGVSTAQGDDAQAHFGGDLRGITEAIPHLRSLSVTGLSLTPIFRALRADKYGTIDFMDVDPALGTVEDFQELVRVARLSNIGIILDGVFGYVGLEHPWFVTGRRQQEEDARLDPSERTRSFFHFTPEVEEGYASFHGEAQHPELNLQNHELRRRLFTGDRSVVHHWLEMGAVGWRLHRADELGYKILREITLSARTGGEQKFIVGDVRGFADRFVKDGLLDGVVNRYLREGVVAFMQGRIPAAQLARILTDQATRYGRDALNRSWTFLSSHDTQRVGTALKGDNARVKLAITLKYALPGTATIYYGEEVGLGGKVPKDSQLPYEWDESTWDQELLGHHRHLGKLKQEYPALSKGDFIDITPPGEEDVLAFARTRVDPRETVIAVFNRAYRPQQRLLFLPVAELPDGLPLRDLMGGESCSVRAGTLNVEVPPTGAMVLTPDLSSKTGHRFFRNL